MLTLRIVKFGLGESAAFRFLFGVAEVRYFDL
jgi:hypothetical protein